MRSHNTKCYPLIVDFLDYSGSRGVTGRIVFNEKDTNTGFIIAELKVNKNPIKINSNTRILVAIKKSDGFTVQNSCEILDYENAIVEIPFTTQSLISHGVNYFEVIIIEGNAEMVSPRFNFRVVDSIIDDETIESSNELGILVELIVEVEDLKNTINELKNNLELAEEIRNSNEEIRQENEETRNSNEEIRTVNENIRITNESTRDTNETDRVKKEEERILQENIRNSNEEDRVLEENIRKSNEISRKYNETAREDNELIRIEQEDIRQENESLRLNQEEFRNNRFNELSGIVEDHYINRLAGGYIHVNTKSELSSLDRAKLKQGMLCHVKEEDIIYKLKIQTPPLWEELSLDGGAGGFKIVKTEIERDQLTSIQSGTLCYVIGLDQYYKYKDGLWEIFQSGTGGGGGTEVTLSTSMDNNLKVAFDNNINISFDYGTTGNNKAGRLDLKVNGISVKFDRIMAGSHSFNISNYVKIGSNTIEITVTDSYGSSDFLIFNIDVIDLSISSTFDNAQIFENTISFNYNAKGNIVKNLYVKVDGVQIYTEVVTTNGVNKTVTIPKQSHGEHVLEVYVEANLEGNTIKSNVLKYHIICVNSSNDTTIISSSFDVTNVDQYTILSIPYMVYSPNQLTTNVDLYVNDEVVSSVVVDRKLQNWNLSEYPSGNIKLKIQAGKVFKEFVLNVEPVGLDINEKTEGLELHLTSKNRINDTNKDKWEFNAIKANFSNFNLITDDWQLDKEGLNVPIPQIDELSKKVKALEEFNVDIVAATWDMDFRIYEIEWLLEDTGILVSEININNKVKVGNYTMATLTKYEQAKIIILGGNYNETVLTRQLDSYLKRNIITQDEYEELINLMNARELVEHK